MQFVFVISCISLLLGFTAGTTGPMFLRILASRFSSHRCNNANWWVTLDRTTWSVCPKTNTYLRGFWRSAFQLGDERVGRLEEGRCCDAVLPQYAGQPATCSNTDLSDRLNRYNVWALCPSGYFMNGLRLGYAPPAFLNNIDEAKCCHPQNHPSSYEDCYDEDVTISFDRKGWSECQRDGFYMTGFYKSSCDKLYCIEKFRCCKMKNDTTDAGWNKWGDWGECSAPCEDGEQKRMRNCSGTNSSRTEVQCIGPNKETRPCNNGPCKVKILDCDEADWQASLDRIGWSVCPRDTTFLKGLWRHDPLSSDNRVGRIEYGRCCAAEEPAFINQSSTCLNADWSRVLNGYNVWALCPTGSFMNGLSVGKSLPAFLKDIDEAKCCHPQNHPSSYEECYDEDVSISFDTRGWSECQRDGFYMTGFYKSSCDMLYCIEKFRCCKMKNETVVSRRWGDWGDWGECSTRCGDGEQERMRNCSGTNSSSTEVQCIGPNKETRVCNNGPCREKVVDCDVADWVASLDRTGWSVCPRDTTFLKGLWRHDPRPGDNRVGRIEHGKCCAAEEPAFINQSSTCLNADWSLVLDRRYVWALCPTGSFMNGLSVGKSLPAFLKDINEAKCCYPQNHPSSYEECYDENVTISFDTRGWSECQRDGFYMTGFYKSSCDELFCIEKFRCCKMKNETVVIGRWSDWEDWGECNAVCGDGEQERNRTCTNPSPSKEQARCSGPSKETRPCNNGPCHESESGCPEGWVHYGNSCFLVIDIPIREWKDARRNCQKLGGDLAKITSATQNQFLLNLLRKQVKFTGLGAWIGLHRRGSNAFYWTDDTPLTSYTAWKVGEPNNVFEKCVHLIGKNWRRGFTPGKWNDAHCILPSWIHYEDVPVALCQKTPNEIKVSSRLR